MERRALLTLVPLAAGLAAAAATRPALAAGGGGGGEAKAYTRFPTVTGTIIRPGGRRGVMTVEIGIDVHEETLRETAAVSAPRLRAAYNEVVAQAARELQPGHAPDVDRLSHELQRATSRILGRGATVLLGTVMVV